MSSLHSYQKEKGINIQGGPFESLWQGELALYQAFVATLGFSL